MAKYQCKTQSAIPTDEGATTATAKSAGGRLVFGSGKNSHYGPGKISQM